MPSCNSMFINGSTNYKPSTLRDHVQTECHKGAARENEEMHTRAFDISLPCEKLFKQYWKIRQ